MSKLTFEHEGENLTAKGEWDGKTYTAFAYKGRKKISDGFSITKEGGKDEAGDEVLENAALNAVKDAVIDGSAKMEAPTK